MYLYILKEISYYVKYLIVTVILNLLHLLYFFFYSNCILFISIKKNISTNYSGNFFTHHCYNAKGTNYNTKYTIIIIIRSSRYQIIFLEHVCLNRRSGCYKSVHDSVTTYFHYFQEQTHTRCLMITSVTTVPSTITSSLVNTKEL